MIYVGNVEEKAPLKSLAVIAYPGCNVKNVTSGFMCKCGNCVCFSMQFSVKCLSSPSPRRIKLRMEDD